VKDKLILIPVIARFVKFATIEPVTDWIVSSLRIAEDKVLTPAKLEALRFLVEAEGSHLGVIPDDPNEPRRDLLVACKQQPIGAPNLVALIEPEQKDGAPRQSNAFIASPLPIPYYRSVQVDISLYDAIKHAFIATEALRRYKPPVESRRETSQQLVN
jgi:hypothetical protein